MSAVVIAAGVVAFLIVSGWAVVRWQTRGRDPSYFDDPSILLPAPPDGMTAATASVIAGWPPGTAFMAGLFDLASRDEIAFRDETPTGPGAHLVGIEIRGGPPADPRVALNRRRPTGEGEAWLLTALKSYAASSIPGFTDDERAVIAMSAMTSLFGLAASRIAAGPPGSPTTPGAPGNWEHAADPQAVLLAMITRSQPGPIADLMRDAMNDPGAILADPQAFAARFQAATGRTPTAAEMTRMGEWLQRRKAMLNQPSTGNPASDSLRGAYISARAAQAFHPPMGFATLLENYARRNGWLAGLSFIARWKWHGLAMVELVAGLLVAAAGGSEQNLVTGAGLGIASGGVATWFIAPFMASRTHEGAVMKAQLAAYRRTLKATFDTSATLDDAVSAAGLPWLETPDQGFVWGVALGLRPEIEALLRRTAGGMRSGAVSEAASLPRWIERLLPGAGSAASLPGRQSAAPTSVGPAAPVLDAVGATAPGATSTPVTAITAPASPSPPAGAGIEPAPIGAPPGADASIDYAGLFAGIEQIGSVAATGVSRR